MDRLEETTQEASGYRWVVFGLWSLCAVSSNLSLAALGLLLPAIASDLRLSIGQQGLLGSAGFWGAMALAIPLSWWGSRYRPKPLTTVTMVLATLFLLLQGWSPAFAVLIVGRLGLGIAQLAREPARAFLIRQWFAEREIILAQSLNNALFGLIVGGGLLATPFVLGSLGDDWRGTLYVFATLLALLTLLWTMLGREREADERPRRKEPGGSGLLWSTLSYRDLWVTGFGFVGVTTAGSAFLNFYPTLMLETYDVSLQWSGAILAVGTVVGGASGFLAAYIATVVNSSRLVLQALGILLAGTMAGMTLTGSIPLLAALSLLNGMAWGFWPVLHSVPFQLPRIKPREIAVAMAFTMVMISGGQVIGPLLTGFLSELLGELRPALVIASFVALSLTVAGTVLRPVSNIVATDDSGLARGR